MKRRDFIQQTMALSALAATGIGWQAADSTPVRVAVVGCGGRGADLIRKLSTITKARIVAVCDDYEPHLLRGKTAAGEQAKGFSDYEKMLREVQPQAVVIATPLYLHYKMAIAAIEAECDVFCEKTMCYSISQARKLSEKVKASQTVFQVGLQRRANPIYQQAMAMVQTGMLGQITTIKCQWHRNGNWRRPIPVGRDHQNWKNLEQRLNWRLYKAYSHGLMTELGSHMLDVASWALGTQPARVMGTAGIDYWRDGREVFDNVFCLYEYPQTNAKGEDYKVKVTFNSIQSNAFEGASELIMGDKGTLLLTEGKGLFYREPNAENPGWTNDADANATIITSGKTLKMNNDPWAIRGKPFEIDTDGDSTRNHLVSFLEKVQNRDKETICDVDTGLQNTIASLSGVQALDEDRVIRIE